MKRNKIKIISTILSLCFTIGMNNTKVFADEIEFDNTVIQENTARSVVSNGLLGYEYHVYSPGKYATFTTTSSDYDEQSIVVDITGAAAAYANDYINAIDDGGISYDRMQNLLTRSQEIGLTGLWIAQGPFAPAALIPAIASLKLSQEAQNYAVEVNDYLNDAERAFRYLYRHRITDNGGCVTIAGQEVCPMSE